MRRQIDKDSLKIRKIKEHKIFLLLIVAFLTAVLLILFSKAFVSGDWEKELLQIKEENGSYNLTDVFSDSIKEILLETSSTFYPNEYVMPDTIKTSSRQNIREYEKIRAQYLSQRFQVTGLKPEEVYRLSIRVQGRHAIKIYVNGELIAQSGRLGTSKKDTQVWENNLTGYAASKDGELDVIVQAAQFYHAKRGASLIEVSIGEKNAIINEGITDREKGLLVMGALLCAASFLFSIYILQPIVKETIYFALACIVMALRECLQSQAWTYFSEFPGNASFMLEYLSVVLLTIFLSLYLGQYAQNKMLKIIKYVIILCSLIYGGVILLGDSLIYTSILIGYQVILIGCIVIGIGGIFRTLRQPIGEQVAALYGIAVFYIAAVRDILMYNDVFGDRPNEPISEAAMLIFVLAQTISLFLMNNRLMTQVKEEEHRQAMEKEGLAKVNQMKTEFLGNVSHELKTPLMVISGYAQNVRRVVEESFPFDSRNVISKMNKIVSETQRMSLLVSQLLDVTKIEEGRMLIEKAPCYIDEIIYEAVDMHFPILNKNKNQLEIRVDRVKSQIQGDAGRLLQVIVNLIANASYHTQNGKIIISAVEEDEAIIIQVKDTGEGMSQQRLMEVFERYTNNMPSNEKNQGTGLGLSICKYIIEEHGGSIQIGSEQGIGTTVTITLPIE